MSAPPVTGGGSAGCPWWCGHQVSAAGEHSSRMVLNTRVGSAPPLRPRNRGSLGERALARILLGEAAWCDLSPTTKPPHSGSVRRVRRHPPLAVPRPRPHRAAAPFPCPRPGWRFRRRRACLRLLRRRADRSVRFLRPVPRRGEPRSRPFRRRRLRLTRWRWLDRCRRRRPCRRRRHDRRVSTPSRASPSWALRPHDFLSRSRWLRPRSVPASSSPPHRRAIREPPCTRWRGRSCNGHIRGPRERSRPMPPALP